MTISSQTRKAGPFIGNGSTTAFPFTFKVFAVSDLVVTRANTTGTETVLSFGTDYSVVLNSNQNSNPGGTVTLSSALALNFRLVITSAVPNLQPVDITNNGGFYPKVINDALDRLTILAQQNTLDNSRSVKVPVTSDITGDQLTAQLFGARDQAAASASAAAGSAAAASSSASSAATSATNAATSATGASTSASNAAASATAAAGSATNAANSATTAGNNATTATTQATNASNSASAAATSATNAAASATTATTKAGEATTAAAAAAGSQTAAASSASAAGTSATNAANSATSASNSAASATSSATAASTSASNAATSATNAASSATSAAGSATTATTQATNASTSASAASTSATNAATSATNAANSATSAASSLTSFRAVYLGSSATNPTVDGNGNALGAGDLYFNTVANEMRVWTGSAWQQVSAIPDTLTERSFVATAGQTSYTFTGGYRVGATYVWVNGSLQDATDIVATNGFSITFNTPLTGGDEVRILSFKAAGFVGISDITGLQTALDAKLNVQQVGGFEFRNRIINGDMRIDQRNAGASVSVAGGAPRFGPDRFQGDNSTANGVVYSVQRVTDAPSGFSNSLRVTVTTAGATATGDYQYIRQQIEGFNFADLMFGTANAQTFTLSFWVKSSVTGTHAGYLGAALNNRFRVFTYTVSAANTWEFKTVTISGDTAGTWDSGNGTGLQVAWALACGASYLGSPGAWSNSLLLGATGQVNLTTTNGATWQVTGVQLEAGSVATPFERRDYGRELIMCQRYFNKSYSTGVAPGTVIADGVIRAGISNTTTRTFLTYKYAVEMRAVPTITVYNNQTGASGAVRNETAATNPTVQAIYCISTSVASGLDLNVGQTANDSLTAQFTASAEL